MKRQLTRLSDDKIIFGVCSGIAYYLGLDKTFVRIIIIVITVFTGFFPVLLLYVLALLIMPVGKVAEKEQKEEKDEKNKSLIENNNVVENHKTDNIISAIKMTKNFNNKK